MQTVTTLRSLARRHGCVAGQRLAEMPRSVPGHPAGARAACPVVSPCRSAVRPLG
ncbi:MAG: hypothetical protein P4L82_22090 [Ancalomicrobiaceae bacterium]|nr:hypothetical protein [Ancalomicrobiaceae bacterium]